MLMDKKTKYESGRCHLRCESGTYVLAITKPTAVSLDLRPPQKEANMPGTANPAHYLQLLKSQISLSLPKPV